MKYLVPRLRVTTDEALWITADDGERCLRVETVPHGRSVTALVRAPDDALVAAAYPERKLMGSVVNIEVGGTPFATLSFRGPRSDGAVHVRARAGEYLVAGDFEVWDFHVLLNTSPVADVRPCRTGEKTCLVEMSDNEAQAPLLAIVLGVDVLAGKE